MIFKTYYVLHNAELCDNNLVCKVQMKKYINMVTNTKESKTHFHDLYHMVQCSM